MTKAEYAIKEPDGQPATPRRECKPAGCGGNHGKKWGKWIALGASQRLGTQFAMIPNVHQLDLKNEVLTPEGCWILETWNDPTDISVSIARARVTPGVTTQWHRLHGVDERYIVTAGSGLMRTGTLAPTRIGPGDIVAIPAGAPQQITNDGDTDLIFHCVCTPRFTPDCDEAMDGARF